MGSAYQAKGFTLAELLLILLIAGLLSAMAIPRYYAHLGNSNRQHAINDILQIASLLEQRQRLGITNAVIHQCGHLLPDSNPLYRYRCESTAPQHYRIQATAIQSYQGDYIYDNAGLLMTDWGIHTDTCWRLAPEAACLSLPPIISGANT